MFYVMNVLLPILLVSTLNSVMLVLPGECGEKMSVSVTIFLTLAVFMTLIKDSLPSNSDTVCYLAIYLATQLTLSVLVVILSTVIVKCYHSNRHVSSAAVFVSSSFGRDLKTNDESGITAHEPSLSGELVCFMVLHVVSHFTMNICEGKSDYSCPVLLFQSNAQRQPGGLTAVQ